MSKTFLAAVALAVPAVLHAQSVPPERTALVEIRTTLGRMVVALSNETPVHRDNFLQLVRTGYYDSTLFHSCVPGFLIQGGDPDSRTADKDQRLGEGGPGYTLPAEFRPDLYHRKGALAAARDADDGNPEKRSNGSRFYLVQGRLWFAEDLVKLEAQRNEFRPDSAKVSYSPEEVEAYTTQGGTPHLDGNYTVFGQVLEGMDVLDRIANQPCNGYDRPLTDVRMWMRVME